MTQKDPLALPQAAFTEVTKAYGVDPKTAHAYCAGVGDLDGDGDDLVFVEMDALKRGSCT